MKFTWFNLMPWPYLPDDFRAKHRSVWVDIPNTLYDPRKGHHVYHEYHGPARVRGDARLRRHRLQRAPPERLRAHAVAQPDRRPAWRGARRAPPSCVIGNSIASYNPPIRVAEEFAMLDVISGGRLVAGFPVGTPMDTNFCYGQIPALTRDKYREAHELIMKAWAERRALRVRRQVQPAPLGELLAQADPAAAPADLHPGRRLDRDVGFLPRLRLQLLLPVVLRLPARQVAARRLLGARRQARARTSRPTAPRSRRSSASPTPTPRPSGSTPSTASTSSTGACTSSRRSPIRAGYRTMATIKYGALAQLTHGAAEDPREPHLEAAGRRALHHRRQPGDGAPAARGVHQGPPHRPPLLPVPQRQHAGLEDAPLLEALRREGHAAPARHVARSGSTTSAGGCTRWTIASVPRSVSPARRRSARSGRDEVADDRDEAGHALPRARGRQRAPLVFLHGAGGLPPRQPVPRSARAGAITCSRRSGRATASRRGEELLEDMLDFTLHGWDLVDALGLRQPHLVGHSMGGMIAAEMACVAPHDLAKLVLGQPGRTVDGRAPDPGHLRAPAAPDRRGALPGSAAGPGPAHRRRRPVRTWKR